MGHRTIQITLRDAHLAPAHQLATVQRLCDTEDVQNRAADTKLAPVNLGNHTQPPLVTSKLFCRK